MASRRFPASSFFVLAFLLAPVLATADDAVRSAEDMQAHANDSQRPVCITRTGREVPCTSPKAARLLKPDVKPRPAMSTRTTMAPMDPTQPRLFFSIGKDR